MNWPHVLDAGRVIRSEDLKQCSLHLFRVQLSSAQRPDLTQSTERFQLGTTCAKLQTDQESRCVARSYFSLQWLVERHTSALSRSATWIHKAWATQRAHRNGTTGPQHVKNGFKCLITVQLVQVNFFCRLPCHVLQLPENQIRSFNLRVASSTVAKTDEHFQLTSYCSAVRLLLSNTP